MPHQSSVPPLQRQARTIRRPCSSSSAASSTKRSVNIKTMPWGPQRRSRGRTRICTVSPEELDGLEKDPEISPLGETHTPLPNEDLGNDPKELKGNRREFVSRHMELWDWSPCLMKETQHRVDLRPGETPARQRPYKEGPSTHQVEAEQVELVRCMGFIEPATWEWVRAKVTVRKPWGSPLFWMDYSELNDKTVKNDHPIPEWKRAWTHSGMPTTPRCWRLTRASGRCKELRGTNPHGLHVPPPHVGVQTASVSPVRFPGHISIRNRYDPG